MKRETVVRLNSSFKESSYQEDGVEYWLARDLQFLKIVPTLQRGNAAGDAPASRQAELLEHRS